MADGEWMGADEGEAAYYEAMAEQAYAEEQAQQALEAEAAYAEHMASQPARSPVDDALNRLERCIDWREGRGRERAAEALATVRSALELLRANQRTGHIIHGDATDDAWNERAFDQQKARAEAAGAENRRLREGLREIVEEWPEDSEMWQWAQRKARALLADSPDGGGAK